MALSKKLFKAAAAGVTNTDNFAPVTYTGNGGTQSITTGFAPDLVWVKSRGSVRNHMLSTSVQQQYNYLSTNLTNAEATSSARITSLDSNGFTIGSSANVNATNVDYVAWCWKAGGPAVSGTGTNGVTNVNQSANTDAGFSIVEFSTPSSGSGTATHGLNETPELIIYKRTSSTGQWTIYISALGVNKFLLFTTAAATTDTGIFSTPSSTTIPVNVNANVSASSDYIAYCFHSVDGYQKIGTYTGTGQPNNDVTTGFRPRWVMIKNTSGEGWNIVDSVRNPSNPANLNIQANSSAAESSTDNPAVQVDFDDTGFSLVAPAGTPGEGQVNSNGTTYIYLAIA